GAHTGALGPSHPDALEILCELGMRSCMSVPLVARGRMRGALTFVSARDPRRYGPSELALAEELARHGAVALDNASLYEEARAAIRAREEFLSIASHELRSPLTSLQLAIDSLGKVARSAAGGLAATPPRFLSSMLETAERQSGRALRLCDTLFDVTLLDAEKLELTLEEIDLAELARDVCAEERAQLAA